MNSYVIPPDFPQQGQCLGGQETEEELVLPRCPSICLQTVLVFPCPWALPRCRGRGFCWVTRGLGAEGSSSNNWNEKTRRDARCVWKECRGNGRNESRVGLHWTLAVAPEKKHFCSVAADVCTRLKHLGGGEDAIPGMFCFRWVDCKENSCC